MKAPAQPVDIGRSTPFVDVIMPPDQFRDLWSGIGTSPERALAAAVVGAAVHDVQAFRHAQRRGRKRRFREAYDWIASDDCDWPYSFVNLCDLLQISTDALRARVLAPDPASSRREAHAA